MPCDYGNKGKEKKGIPVSQLAFLIIGSTCQDQTAEILALEDMALLAELSRCDLRSTRGSSGRYLNMEVPRVR